MKPRALVITTLVLFSLCACAGAGYANPLDWFHSQKPTPETSAPVPTLAPSVRPALPSFADIVRAVEPAVVNVSTKHTVQEPGMQRFGPFSQDDPFYQFFRHFGQQHPRSFTQQSLGSGVIIDPQGHVVTNAHVVKDADEIVVKLDDERELKAKIVGIDEKTDVALLEVEGGGNFSFATFGDSDKLQVGDWVVAIGNPFGLSETVTAGIVSAKGRVIGAGPYDDFIQTDASINPGNSGGPLLDLSGKVVGINSAIYSRSGGNIGIGFAIPINLVRHVVDQLREHGKVTRGWLGVLIQDVTPELAHSFGLKEAEGALVSEVNPDSPAEKAGIERGDVIIEFDGKHIDHSHNLPALVADTPIGTKVEVKVLRDGKEKTLYVKLGEMPAEETAESTTKATGDWGLTVEEITPDVAQQLDLRSDKGVLVQSVEPGSPADEAGIQAGDVITQVNRKSIRGTSEYRKALKDTNGKTLLLLIEREGHSLFVVLQRGG